MNNASTHTFRLFLLLVAAALLLCHAAAPALAAQAYEVVDLGTLGGNESEAKDINESGQIVGYAEDGSGRNRAFLWENGTMTDLGALGGNESVALAISDPGQIVGEADTGAGTSHAFSWSTGGGMADLGTLGGNNSVAWDINNTSKIVGESETGAMSGGAPVVHAFSLNGGPMQDLGTLTGGTHAQALGVNASGQIAGWSMTTGVVGWHAFFYDGAPMTDIGTPGLGGDHSGAMAIDDAGNIVGEATPVAVGTRAFLYTAGAMTDLGSLGGSTGRGTDINAARQIVGWSHIAGGTKAHAFVYDSANGMQDLNNMIPAGSGWLLIAANGINESGWIVGYGEVGGEDHAFLLKPESSSGGCCFLPFGPAAILGLMLAFRLVGRGRRQP